jgi:hypothetical protein
MKTKFLALCLLPLATACSSGPIAKAALDDEVRRLCAIDGGIKVYETVKLPAEKFNQWGQVTFAIPLKEAARPDDQYFYEWKTDYYRKEIPYLYRNHFKLFRVQDVALLGEAIGYVRRGGDAPGPWHDSSFDCPSDAGITNLKQRVFTIRQEKAAK